MTKLGIIVISGVLIIALMSFIIYQNKMIIEQDNYIIKNLTYDNNSIKEDTTELNKKIKILEKEAQNILKHHRDKCIINLDRYGFVKLSRSGGVIVEFGVKNVIIFDNIIVCDYDEAYKDVRTYCIGVNGKNKQSITFNYIGEIGDVLYRFKLMTYNK